MDNAKTRHEREHIVFSYSLIPRVLFDAVLMALIFAGNIYFQLSSNGSTNHVNSTLYLALIEGLGAYDILNNWRKPLRSIRFFDNHFEVVGWNERQTASYEDLEYLKRKKRIIGDFRSGSAVWFSIKDDPNDLMVPNRKVGRPKMELYSWLLQKNPKAGTQA